MTNKLILIKSDLERSGVLKVDSSLIKGKYIFLSEENKELGEEVVLFRNKKGYSIFTCEEWEDLFNKINIKYKRRKRRLLKRSFSKRARKVKIKKDGIILIPSPLRKS